MMPTPVTYCSKSNESSSTPSAKSPPVMTKLSPTEYSRTYHMTDGSRVTFKNVTAISVSPSGTHRLEFDALPFEENKAIILAGTFKYITLHADTWTL